jgi:general secretion pathway protein I
VALSIVAVALSAISSLMATSSRGAHSMEKRLTRLETARAVITALPDRDQPIGSLSGEIAGHSWRVEASPLIASPQPNLSWIPQAVVVTVGSPGGGTTQIHTVRLQQKAGK